MTNRGQTRNLSDMPKQWKHDTWKAFQVCPRHTKFAAYNALAGKSRLIIGQGDESAPD
jgi:hypothetical protein